MVDESLKSVEELLGVVVHLSSVSLTGAKNPGTLCGDKSDGIVLISSKKEVFRINCPECLAMLEIIRKSKFNSDFSK